jgi:hypothetical protein
VVSAQVIIGMGPFDSGDLARVCKSGYQQTTGRVSVVDNCGQ